MSRQNSSDRTLLTSYFREVNRTPLLAEGKLRELSHRVLEGDPEARDHMVRANLRLVVRLSREFMGRGVSLPDLIQEGSLGLMRAVEGFDPDRETRFSTYASFWIKQSLQRAVERMSKSVRVPGYAVDMVTAWRRKEHELRAIFGRPATENEIGDALEFTDKQRKIAQRALRVYNGAPNSDQGEGDGTATDEVADRNSTDPADKMAADDDFRHMQNLLAGLEGREAAVLRLRFGLAGDAPKTLQEIGRQLNLTRERVRQIERDTLMKLREQMCA